MKRCGAKDGNQAENKLFYAHSRGFLGIVSPLGSTSWEKWGVFR